MPFFAEVIKGCFVKLGIGQHEGKMVYRVRKISIMLFIVCLQLLFHFVVDSLLVNTKLYDLDWVLVF